MLERALRTRPCEPRSYGSAVICVVDWLLWDDVTFCSLRLPQTTFLCEGGLGYVATSEDTRNRNSGAVKICKSHPTVLHQAQEEVAVSFSWHLWITLNDPVIQSEEQ